MVNISSVFECSAAYHQRVRDGSVRRSFDQNSRRHAGDADVIRTIATRILESATDLLAQLWSTFGIVDRCIGLPREYVDLLCLSENRTNSACSLLPTLRSGCRSSFADTTEYDYEPPHIGGVPDCRWPGADLLPATGDRARRPTLCPPASAAKAMRRLNGCPHTTRCPKTGFTVTDLPDRGRTAARRGLLRRASAIRPDAQARAQLDQFTHS